MIPQKQVPIEDVCKILEIPLSSWKLIGKMSVEQARINLEEFKTIVKKQKRILAKKYHPDKTGNEDDTKIKEVNNVIDLVMKLEITVMQRKPQPTQFRFHSFTSDASTSTGTTGNVGGFRFFYSNRR